MPGSQQCAQNMCTLIETGLSTNTLNFGQLVASNALGTSTSTWANATTFAAQPAPASITAVSTNSITVSWGDAGNPPGTMYLLQAYYSIPPNNLATQTNVFTTSATISGLAPQTSYYLELAAFSNGVPSVQTGFTYVGSTATLALPPSPPSTPTLSGVPLGVSSITWSWGTTINNGQFVQYFLYSSTGVLMPGSQQCTPTSCSVIETGLSTNTAYSGQLVASNLLGNATTQWSTANTLAAQPESASIIAVLYNSITVSWGDAGNPPGTTYNLEAHYGLPPTPGNLAGQTNATTTSGTLPGLSPQTIYYLWVEAYNNTGQATGFTYAGSTRTPSIPPDPPPAPQNLRVSALGVSSLTWTWSSLGSQYSAQYIVLSTAGVPLSGTLNTNSWVETGLSTNTAYAIEVQAFNIVGSTTSGPSAAFFTAAAPPAISSFAIVGISSITLFWDPNTNPAQTQFVAVMQTPPPVVTTQLYTTSTDITFGSLYVGTTYTMFVYALNGDGLASADSVRLSTFIPPGSPSVNQCFYPETGGTIQLTVGYPNIFTVSFPPGAFPVQYCATLSTTTAPHALSNAARLSPLINPPEALEILVHPLNSAAILTHAANPISITMQYPSSDLTGTGFAADQLVIAAYDTLENVWVPLPSSYPSAYMVAGQATEISSVFQVMGVTPAASGQVSMAMVYPNPFRPALHHTVVTFSQLAAGTRVRLYTILGELVKDLSADATGIARWDATNQSGQNVASGGYFALIQTGGEKKILKVMVQR